MSNRRLPRFAMHPAPVSAPHAHRARLLAALACCVLAGQVGAAPAQALHALSDPAAASQWPRVFYTPGQRASIENLRKQPPEGPGAPAAAPAAALPAPTYSLDGLALGRKNATAWINGQMLQQGETYAGRTVHIENGQVRLRLSGESDIVLRPGQQVDETGTVLQDVVPSDAFRKKLGSSAH